MWLKSYTLKITLLFLIMTASQDMDAATVSWNGGFGFWNQASRWSTGVVPAAGDDVIINNGFVIIPQNFTAHSRSVSVASNSAFRIEFNATLNIMDGLIDQQAFINNCSDLLS